MNSLLQLLVVYVLGGITFVPLLIVAFFVYGYYTFPVIARDAPYHDGLRQPDDSDGVFKTDNEKLVRRLANSVDVAAGYFLVTREYVPGGVNGKPPERVSPAGTTASTPSSESPSMYQSMYRSLFDRKSIIGPAETTSREKARGKRAKNEFYVVLRHGHLMLYDDEDQTEVRHVISLSLYTVDIYGGGEVIPEGELYIKRNAIRLVRRPGTATNPAMDHYAGSAPFFLFSENCSMKEDFYLALVKDQEKNEDDPAIPPKPMLYNREDIVSLVQRLHSSEDHLQMNWVNGLMGRVFLSVYKTKEVEEFFRMKIIKKISRVNKPNFLSDIKLEKIDVGTSVPYITNPRLKEMTTDGDFCAEFDITYSGNFRLELATKATLNLGARFKPREVTLVLACVLKKLEGHALIRIKPPPSNRLWFSFERMPKMDLSIEPIIQSRQVAWGPILRLIEARMREVVAETVVFPFFDDIPFTDTINQRFRGGIWKEKPKPRRPNQPVPEPGSPEQKRNEKPEQEEPEEEKESEDDPVMEPATEPETPAPEDVPASIFLPATPLKDDSSSGKTTGTSASSASTKSLRSGRAHTITPAIPSPPSIGTDAVNVTAVKSSDSLDSAFSSLRNRSSSSPQSPTPTSSIDIPQSRTNTLRHPSKLSPPSLSNLEDTLKDGFHSAKGKISGGSATSFGSNSSQTAMTGFGNTPAPHPGLKEKPSITALSSAATAVKKWYSNRSKEKGPDTPDAVAGGAAVHHHGPHLHHLHPPAEIAPQKKSPAVPVPKQKRDQAPQRRRKKTPPVALGTEPPEMLVIAAPSSGGTTPREGEGEMFLDMVMGAGTPEDEDVAKGKDVEREAVGSGDVEAEEREQEGARLRRRAGARTGSED